MTRVQKRLSPDAQRKENDDAHKARSGADAVLKDVGGRIILSALGDGSDAERDAREALKAIGALSLTKRAARMILERYIKHNIAGAWGDGNKRKKGV